MKDRLIGHLYKNQAYWICVLIPTLLLAFYYSAYASDRYVSEAKLIVQGDNLSSFSVAALGFLLPGASSGNLDADLVKSYILSPAMIESLDSELELRKHYSASSIDLFSRIPEDASAEEFLEYYLKRVSVVIDDAAPIITLKVEGFDAAYAKRVADAVVNRAELFVNEVSQSLARDQVSFVQGELDNANERLHKETGNLVQLQNRNRMLDPVLESQSVAQIIVGLQQELARLRTERTALEGYLSPTAPDVVSMQKKIAAIEGQINQERAKQVNSGDKSALNELVLAFKERETSVQVAADIYQGSLKSLEAAKLDASRKVKHLVRISAPTLPQDALMPRRLYNLTTVFVLLNLLFWVGRLLYASVRDHQE